MPPKKKGKGNGKKGKGKGKGKKGKRRSKSRTKIKHMTPEQATGFLALVMYESRKQSALFYKMWYLEQKEEMKTLRHKLHRLEKEQHSLISSLLLQSDSLTSHFTAIPTSTLNLPSTFSHHLSLDPYLIKQRAQIDALNTQIENLELANEELSKKQKEMVRFQENGTSGMEEDIIRMRQEAAQEVDRRRKELDALRKRHNMSVEGVKRRTEGIVNGVETVASQQVIDAMSLQNTHTWKVNKQLEQQLSELLSEERNLANIVQQLEEQNLDLVWEMVDVEWNFNYDDDDTWVLDREEEDDKYPNQWDEENPDSEDDSDTYSDTFSTSDTNSEPHTPFLPSRQSAATLRLPPLAKKPERATEKEWIHKAVTGQLRPLSAQSTQLLSTSTAPSSQVRLPHIGRVLPASTDPKEMEEAVKNIFALERQRREEDAKLFGVWGQKMDVTVGIGGSESGGLKYYDPVQVMA